MTPTFSDERPDGDDRRVRQRVRRQQRQGGEQDVARHHVGEESDRQRERPHHCDLDELDRGEEDVERLRHARREQVAGEVLHALVLEPEEPVEDVHHQREEHRDGDARGRRELQPGDDLPDVQEEHEQEQRAEERCEPGGVVADDVTGDAPVDELVGGLDDVLHAARDQLHLARGADEDDQDQRRRDQDQQRRLVDRERGVLEDDVLPTEELVDRRELEDSEHGWRATPRPGCGCRHRA